MAITSPIGEEPLMEAPRTAILRRPIPWGLLGMLTLIWGVEGLIDHRIGPLYSLLASDWAMTAEAVGRETLNRDLLCLGDSQIKLGVQPITIENRSGIRSYNLALNRGLPSSSEFLLRKALAAGARPRAIVLGASPGLLAASPRLNGLLWPELVGLGEILDISWTARDPRPALQAISSRLLPSNNAREEIRFSIVAALRGDSNDSIDRTSQFRRNWQANLGAQAHPKNLGFLDLDLDVPDDPATGGRPVSWRPRPENVAHLRRLLRLAAEHDIRVYWLAPGFSPAAQARRERNGLDAAYTRFLDALRSEFPSLIVLDGRRLGLDASFYIDPVHLDHEGAEILSAFVAKALIRTLERNEAPPNGWIDLATLADSATENLADRPRGERSR
ncbi:hypothetical protein BH23PLA1_BH23PLA1_14780 [soil metagenome]